MKNIQKVLAVLVASSMFGSVFTGTMAQEVATNPIVSQISDTQEKEALIEAILKILRSQPLANKPFPSTKAHHEDVTKPNHVTQKQMNTYLTSYYEIWKERYLKQDPEHTDAYYLFYNTEGYSSPANAVTVSEANGYGMIVTAMMAGYDQRAKVYFDGLYKFSKLHPSKDHPELMAWQQVMTPDGKIITNPDGGDSVATDGELDMAYALLVADKQWGSDGEIDYKAEAIKKLNVIMNVLIDEETNMLKLGDWHDVKGDYGYGTRPSDFTLSYFPVFEKVTGDKRWAKVKTTAQKIANEVHQNYSKETGLLPDFVVLENGKYHPAPVGYLEGDHDGAYYYNACRVPWRLASDYILNGDESVKDILNTMNSWVREKTNGDLSNYMAGYTLEGENIEGVTWTDMVFISPLLLSAMTEDNQEWVNTLWDTLVYSPLEYEDYFDMSIKLQVLLIATENWWSPVE